MITQEELVKKYPKCLRDYGGDMMETCMCFGLEVKDEWLDVLDSLFSVMEACGCWNRLVKAKDEGAKSINITDDEYSVVLEQVKEKFGELRVYYRFEDKIPEEKINSADPQALEDWKSWKSALIDGAITMAETMCKKI